MVAFVVVHMIIGTMSTNQVLLCCCEVNETLEIGLMERGRGCYSQYANDTLCMWKNFGVLVRIKTTLPIKTMSCSVQLITLIIIIIIIHTMAPHVTIPGRATRAGSQNKLKILGHMGGRLQIRCFEAARTSPSWCLCSLTTSFECLLIRRCDWKLATRFMLAPCVLTVFHWHMICRSHQWVKYVQLLSRQLDEHQMNIWLPIIDTNWFKIELRCACNWSHTHLTSTWNRFHHTDHWHVTVYPPWWCFD